MGRGGVGDGAGSELRYLLIETSRLLHLSCDSFYTSFF